MSKRFREIIRKIVLNSVIIISGLLHIVMSINKCTHTHDVLSTNFNIALVNFNIKYELHFHNQILKRSEIECFFNYFRISETHVHNTLLIFYAFKYFFLQGVFLGLLFCIDL